MEIGRRSFIRLSGAALLGVAASTSVGVSASAQEPKLGSLPKGATPHVWRASEWGTAPYIERQDLLRKEMSSSRIHRALEQFTAEADRLYRENPEEYDVVRQQLALDREQFADEATERFWKEAPLLFESDPNLPQYSQVELIGHGEHFDRQMFRGGKVVKNVIADHDGLRYGTSDRAFVLTGGAMRIAIPGVCGNVSLQKVKRGKAVCVPLPKGKPRTVAEALRHA